MTYRVRITDLMTGAHEVSAWEAHVRSLDDLRARCRDVRESAGEGIRVEAVRRRRLPLPPRRLTWAVA